MLSLFTGLSTGSAQARKARRDIDALIEHADGLLSRVHRLEIALKQVQERADADEAALHALRGKFYGHKGQEKPTPISKAEALRQRWTPGQVPQHQE